jgi:hypothetical protein
MSHSPKRAPDYTRNPLIRRIVCEGIRIQHRFRAKPYLARHGRGWLKSEGVAPLLRIKARLRRNRSTLHA